MSQIRLYLDEDAMRRSLVFGLRERNVDVLTALEARMVDRADEDHLRAASHRSACLVYIQRGRLLQAASGLARPGTTSCRDHCRTAAVLHRGRGTPTAYAPNWHFDGRRDQKQDRVPFSLVLNRLRRQDPMAVKAHPIPMNSREPGSGTVVAWVGTKFTTVNCVVVVNRKGFCGYCR